MDKSRWDTRQWPTFFPLVWILPSPLMKGSPPLPPFSMLETNKHPRGVCNVGWGKWGRITDEKGVFIQTQSIIVSLKALVSVKCLNTFVHDCGSWLFFVKYFMGWTTHASYSSFLMRLNEIESKLIMRQVSWCDLACVSRKTRKLLGPGNRPAKLPKRLSGVSQSTRKILSPKNTSFFPVNFTGTHYLPKSVFGSVFLVLA